MNISTFQNGAVQRKRVCECKQREKVREGEYNMFINL